MQSEEFVKQVHVSEGNGHSRRERPLGRWKNSLKEYKSERCVPRERRLEHGGGRVWIERSGGFSAIATHLRAYVPRKSIKHQSCLLG